MAKAKRPTLEKVGGETVFHRFRLSPAFKGTKKTPKFEPLPFPTAADGSDPVLTALIRKLGGDAQLAKRIMKLADQFPVATIPELLVYTWLQREGLKFEFQVPLMGGRNMSGGLVVDFLLYRDGTSADVLSVNGNFWHSISRKGLHDQTASLRMIGQQVRGATIARVIEIWESDLLTKYDMVMRYAMAGINLRGIGGV